MIKLFGIKGYKASGKTSTAIYIKKHNIPIIILEDLYVDLLKPGTNVHKEILKYLGEEVIKKNGDLDISVMSMLAYREKWIKDFIDDVIGEESENFINLLMDTFEKYKIDIAGVEVGLVDDERISRYFDEVLFVDCPWFLRVNRMKDKYKFNDNIIYNMLEVDKRKDIEYDYYINNEEDLGKLKQNTDNFVEEYILNNRI